MAMMAMPARARTKRLEIGLGWSSVADAGRGRFGTGSGLVFRSVGDE